MTWKPAPALVSILLDANRVAPHRSHASDGIIGDAAHAASASDHNPDSRGIVHACDVTNDPAGGFDAWAQAHRVSQRISAGLETRVKYLVSNAGTGADQIFSKNPTWAWRQNGSYKTEHRSHLHVSILYTEAAENDQTPFFSADSAGGQTPQGDPPMTIAELGVIGAAIDKASNRVIGTLQTNMKQEFIPAIVAGVAKATGADPKVIAAAVAHEMAKNLENG